MPEFTLPPRGANDGSQTPTEGYGGGANTAPREYPVIPDGEIVDVEVVEVELRDRPEWAIRNPDDETKEISFRFRVVNGPYAKANLWGTTMPWFDYSPKCKFRLWVQGIEGVTELPEGFSLETIEVPNDKKPGEMKTIFPAFTSKQARVLVGNRRNKKTGKLNHFAQDVFPAKQYQDVQDAF